MSAHDRPPTPTRGRFLRGALTAGVGVAAVTSLPLTALAEPAAAPTPGHESVQDIIDIALIAEQLATTFYYTGLTTRAILSDTRVAGSSADPNHVAPNGNVANVAFLQAALDQEQKHARILANAGADSPYKGFYFPAHSFDGLGFTSRTGTFLWVLDHLETAFIGAYIAAVQRFGALQRPDFAALAMRFLGVECQHRALYRAISRDDPADNITLEVAEFAHVADAAGALAPFLTGKGFADSAIGPIAIPPTDQVVRVVGKNISL